MIQFFRSLSNDNNTFFSPREIRITSLMNFGFFRSLKALIRFLEITQRYGLEIGGAFYPFFKKVGKHTIKFKTCLS